MSAARSIRWHLEEHRGAYLGLVAALLTAVAVTTWGIWHQDRGLTHLARVRSWPAATATILESRIVMSDASTETSLHVRITVSGRLCYRHPDQGEMTLPFFLNSGGIHPRDWQGTFKPGAEATIRYSPERPAEISFIDFTGCP